MSSQGATSSSFSGRKILKVHELTAEIRHLIEQRFSDLWVEGEVSDLRRPRSGHLYFTLKDPNAKIKAIIFQSHTRFLRFLPEEGTLVLIRGHLSLYEPRGEYQLICDYIEPRGAGALQASFEALKEKLRLEGLFSPDRKKSIPGLPSRIGVITSSSGAAIQDIVKVIQGGDFRCHLLLYPVSVQGEGAAAQITHALDEINRYSQEAPKPLDLLILTRGGGSLEDLWPFNEACVARAIARSLIPVISAVGHESDTTISDYVADLRAPTPSVAASIVVQKGMASEEAHLVLKQRLIEQMKTILETHKERIAYAVRLLVPPKEQCQNMRDHVGHLSIRLHRAIDRLLENRRGDLARAQQGIVHLSPLSRLEDLRIRLDRLCDRLTQEGRRTITHQKIRLKTEMEQLNLLSPLNILGRGYSITRLLPTLTLVRSTEEVSVHDKLQITLHQGHLICTVEEKDVS